MSLYRSKSQNMIKTIKITPKYLKIKRFTLSPKIVHPRINALFNKRNSILNIPNNSLSSRSKKFTNHYIFMKREMLFNKSVEENKLTFKYQNYTLLNKKKGINIGKNQSKRNLIKDNSSRSLYLTGLTDSILKANKSMFSFIPNENLNTFDLDNNEKKINNLEKIKNKTNTIFNNYNNFGNRRKKINLKLINDKDLFKTFDWKIQKVREIKNITNIEKKDILLQKLDIFDNCKKKELTRTNYIYNIKDYLSYKLNLIIKKEKSKVLNENMKDEINLIDDTIGKLKKNFDSFSNNFFHTFDKYTKQLSNNIKIEKDKDNKLLELINHLKQKITSLKLKINKLKYNDDDLNKYIYLFLCIKEKKMKLPNYYTLILENRIYEQKNELKKINKNEIERISNYKKNIIDLDPDYIFDQIRKYENEDIDLIKRYNVLRNEIIILQNEKEELENYINISEKDASDEIIESKKKILLNLKKNYCKLNNDIQCLSSYLNKNEDDEDIHIAHNKLSYIVKLLK